MATMMRRARNKLVDLLQEREIEPTPLRKKPLQERDATSFMYAPSPQFEYLMAQFAYREWISTPILRMAEMAISSPLQVQGRADSRLAETHPLAELLGIYGQPNETQDSIEFLEQHFQTLDIFGNSFWFWFSSTGGASPDMIHRLEPDQMFIAPGRNRTIEKYVYKNNGAEYDIDPAQLTHFRRANPLKTGSYWGMSAIDVLRNTVESDKQMTHWNMQAFTTGSPSGILIVDSDVVSAKEQKRIEFDLHQQAEKKRRVMVIRARPGSAVWNDAMLKAKDMDYSEGRLLTRQACFDAMGFHTGLLSETSTEAHARIAKRYVLESVYMRHIRTASLLNQILGFWGSSSKFKVVFKDIRQVDWEQEEKKLKGIMPYMSINEVRDEHLHLQPISSEELNDGKSTGTGRTNEPSGSSGKAGQQAGEANGNNNASNEDSNNS